MSIKKFTGVQILFLGLILGMIFSTNIFGAAVIQVKGSDTIVNASQSIVENFMMKNKGVRVAVSGGGSGVGISGLLNKTTDIALSSRDISAKELSSAKEKKINIKENIVGYDGITVIVNKSNKVKKLSQAQLGKIFRGEITNWKDVGGDNAPITILSRDSSSGTHVFFKEQIINEGNSKGTKEYGAKTLFLQNNEGIKSEVVSNKNSIGYIGMGYMDETVKNITVDNVDPTVANVASKKYPISRALYWYVATPVNSEVQSLINFALSADGQKIIAEEGFVPVKK
ncbi:MAG: PstS family phosphate ABC transporter substrate-binding protein [Fusobacteriaceae bacterium]